MPRQHRLMQWCRMRMVAFRIVAVGVLPGIEQQANDLQMSVLRCEGERAVARFGVRGREETGGIVPEAKACGGGQIDTCAALCQDGGCIAHPEGERGQERASPFPGAASFDGGAELQQRLDERHLKSRLGRIAARYQHVHGGALGTVHVGERVGFGPGPQQRAGNFDSIGRRLLAVRLHAVGGHIVQQRGAVGCRIETADAARTGADESRIAAERILQRSDLAIDHSFDGGFEFEN